MNYREWMSRVPQEFTEDALWRMQVYRLAMFAGDVAWMDVSRLMQDRRTLGLASQLYDAVGSVGANLAEGYSRRSHKDQARFYEYSLGSARESRDWYWKARFVLGESVAKHRIALLTQIIRQMLIIIPAERGHSLREAPIPYLAYAADESLECLLEKIPLPDSQLDAPRTTQHPSHA